jgi:lipopolysaccharide/colanic/teichoic acid biosynthesis glycosyltransferase
MVTKRLVDVGLTLLVAPLAVVVTLVAALVLAVELRGNPFFLQRRIGRHGRPFTMFKLRTMSHAGPDEASDFHVEDWSTFYFSPPGEDDPRVSRLGGLARSTSIDELPNLLNVFLGDMSLVGPRPEIPEIVGQFPDEYHRRHDVLPGIAGLAQACGRSDMSYAEIVAKDLEYVDGHCFTMDISILSRTLAVVATGRGAR